MLKIVEGSKTLELIKYKAFRENEENADDEVKNNHGGLMQVEQKLNNARQLQSNNTLICKEESNEADIGGTIYLKKNIKIEDNFEELEGQKLINVNGSLMVVQLNNVQQFTPELEDKKCLIVEEIEIKMEQNEFDSLQGKDASPQPRDGNQLPRCCGSLPKERQCDSCSCQTNCEVDVEAKYKIAIHKQVLSQKNSSEITMYQCEICSMKTKYKYSLRMHMLRHKNPPKKITIYQCESCPYQVRRKIDLAKHMLTHKAPTEIEMYQCDICEFKTKYKGSFRSHMITHNRHVEITMYQCGICPFKAENRGGLYRHMVIHKDPQK